MPKPRKIALETPTARAKLTPRKPSYFVRVSPHIALGYRRNASGFGTWSVRYADGSPNGWLKKFGTADDMEPADDKVIFNYDQAIAQARKLARGDTDADTNTASGFAPISVDGALSRYEDDLKARQGSIYNARMPRKHLTAALLAKPVALLSANELKKQPDRRRAGGFLDQPDAEVLARRAQSGGTARSANPEQGCMADRTRKPAGRDGCPKRHPQRRHLMRAIRSSVCWSMWWQGPAQGRAKPRACWSRICTAARNRSSRCRGPQKVAVKTEPHAGSSVLACRSHPRWR